MTKELWLLLWKGRAGLVPLYRDNEGFWLGGSCASLAAYQTRQGAYAARKQAVKDLKERKIIARKALISY